jgi:hypothetical protein
MRVVNKQNRHSESQSRSALGEVGARVGSVFGPMGSKVGATAGDFISKIAGWGSYTINRNSLTDPNSVPTFSKDGDGLRVRHREFITDITGATAFTLISNSVNPGLSALFPWLSNVAENFEEYRFDGLVFEYRPSSGSAVSTSSAALGVVVYAMNYNPSDPNFVNKQQMESYEFSSSTVPFNSMLHPVECAPLSNTTNKLFVRSGPVPTGGALQLYDMGNFQFAVQGMQSAYVCGELWVSYDAVFSKPRINPNTNYLYSHVVEQANATASAAHPLGTSNGATIADSNLPGIFISGSAPTTTFGIQFAGSYFVFYTWNGSVTVAPTFTPGSNIALSSTTPFVDGTVNNVFNAVSGGVCSGCVTFTVSANGTGAANSIVITGLTNLAAGKCDIMIFGLPTNFD